MLIQGLFPAGRQQICFVGEVTDEAWENLERDYIDFLPKEGKAVRSTSYLMIKEPPLRQRVPLIKSHIKDNQ